jgi:hypothetical protein
MRSWIKRLERASREELESFELLDGSRYYYDPTSAELFLHWTDCLRAGSAHNWPDPPEVVRKLTEARDVEQAMHKVCGEGWNCLVYDPGILINERRLEPRGLVTRYDPETGKHHVGDPYEEPPFRDLSEQAREGREDGSERARRS